MKVGDELRFVVRDLDLDGAGVGPAAGTAQREIHVAGALPDEEISARIDDLSAHRPIAWATLRTIHRVSTHRVPPACSAHGRCGGCVLQHCGVGEQRRWKEAWLRQRIALEPLLAGTPVSPMVASPRALGYRNNAKLVAARDRSGRLVLGGYAPRSHAVVDLSGCAITETAVESIATALREILPSHDVQPYDEVRQTGLLRYVVLRANAAGEVLVTLVTSGESFPAGVRVAEALAAHAPHVAGVVQNVNRSRGNTIFGPVERSLTGASTIEDRVGEVRLRLSSRAFFQANRDVARAAYAEIVRAVAPRPTDRVVDAFTGVGGIALTLAPDVHSITGIEEHAGAVRDAEASAILNGVTNARFVAGDVAAHLGAIGAADIVVLNPPRKGCERDVLAQVTALAPRTIAYLSCSPETLIRDLAILAALRYRTAAITPFDMLPHTPHVETLAILSRQGAAAP